MAADMVVVVELDMRPARKRVETANRGGRDARLMRGPAEIRDGNVARRIGFWIYLILFCCSDAHSAEILTWWDACAFRPAWLHMFSS